MLSRAVEHAELKSDAADLTQLADASQAQMLAPTGTDRLSAGL